MLLQRASQLWRFAKFGLPLSRMRPETPRTIADVIEEQAAARARHPFVIFEGRTLSYDEYNRGANRVAHWALAQGIGRGQRVALLMQNRPEFLETWAGLAKVGATSALINTNLTGRALEHAIDTADARHLIVGSELLPLLATVDDASKWQVWVANDPASDPVSSPAGARDLADDLASRPSANPPASARAGAGAGDDLFYIYTSGTTGLPKAARFSHLKFFTTEARRALRVSSRTT